VNDVSELFAVYLFRLPRGPTPKQKRFWVRTEVTVVRPGTVPIPVPLQSLIALIVAGMDSLKDRREILIARFFHRQVLASNALLHYLLPEWSDNDTICSLRNSQPFPSIRARTHKFHESFLSYCLITLQSQLN